MRTEGDWYYHHMNSRPSAPARRLPLASRAAGITGSAIDSTTSLLQTQTHDIVSFAMGSPAPEAIPSAALAEIAADVMAPDGASVYGYGPTEGEAQLLDLVAERSSRERTTGPQREQLLITTGAMQGLDLACKLLVDPGDVVATESPTYTNATAVITGYGGELLEVGVDENGVDVAALAELGASRPPKLIYVVPTFQNPSGVTLSRRRRTALIELAERWGAVLLEDDPYGELRFGGERLPSLRELAAGSETIVITVRTFSKVLAPGLRVGWVEADPEVIAAMIDAKQGLDTCTSVPMQRVVAEFMARGLLDAHIAGLRRRYADGKRAMQEALAASFPEPSARWTDPGGGFFLWLTLADAVDTEALFAPALADGVAFIPGPAFSASGRFPNALRLSFASTDPPRTREGVSRLRRAVDRQLAGSPAPDRGGSPAAQAQGAEG